MGWLLALFLAASVKQANTALRAGCAEDSHVVASLPAGTPIKLRYSLAGESVVCYKVAADMGGRQVEGYLSSAAIEDLDSFDKLRREAVWVTTNDVLNVVRNSQPLPSLKANTEVQSHLPPSARVILAQ